MVQYYKFASWVFPDDSDEDDYDSCGYDEMDDGGDEDEDEDEDEGGSDNDEEDDYGYASA